MISFTALVTVAVFVVTVMLVFFKWMHNYREGKITRVIFVRNIFFEIIGILLAMTLAGLLGKYIAQKATAQIANELAKLIAGIIVGLLAGMSMGILMKRTCDQLLKIRN